MTLQVRLLGTVGALVDGVVVDIGHARQRCVLAALAIDAGRAVPVDVILDRVWAGRPPQRARNALAGYVSRLRAALAAAGEGVILTRRDGYLANVDPSAVDLHRFRQLVADARAADSDEAAVRSFDDALALWRGEALATLDTPWADAMRASLEAERHLATLDRNDAALRLGRHAELLPALLAAVSEHPLDERLAEQLLLAQYRSGRQADALRHYDQIRSRLADELGVDPGPALRALHRRMLQGDPGLAGAAPPPATTVPRQLPAPPGSFVGRAAELAELDAGLGEDAVVIHTVTGPPGVGKTTLALRWAHRAAPRFPDGQLYVNLHGFDATGTPVTADEALRYFLEALGVPPDRAPSTVESRSALYRSLLANRRMMVVLDNACDVDQARPLLPGTAGCAVVVTSRNLLSALVVGEGARPLVLSALPAATSRELLASRLGEERVGAEPVAVVAIVAACAGLPLALSIVAARAAVAPALGLDAVAAQLGDPGGPLAALSGVDPVVDARSVFWWSYRSLSPDAGRLFRRLGLHPGPDVGVAAAASLDGTTVPTVRSALAELADASLVTEPEPGRFVLHDLVQAYAGELARAIDDESDRRGVVRRVLDHYLHTAHAADVLLNPNRDRVAPPPPAPGVVPERLADDKAAMAWFIAEQRVLLAAVEQAARGGLDGHAWRLPQALASFLGRRGRWEAWAATQHRAVDAAQRLGDVVGQGLAHRSLGRAYTRLGRREDGLRHLRRSADLFDALGDVAEQAQSWLNLAWAAGLAGRYRDAVPLAQGALDRYRSQRHHIGEANALAALAWYQACLGHHAAALEAGLEAVEAYQKAGDRHGEGATWDTLALAYRGLGRLGEAVECGRRAHRLLVAVGDRYPEAEVLVRLGDILGEAGEVDEAREAWRRALAILTDLRHPDVDAVATRLARGDNP